ncbi:MAG: transcriptional repressor [Firmicutes bacterium]|nr:transcriptional repressor [Bacillota bacterium]
MRYSKQRETVLNVVNKSRAHPTAEMVYQEVKKEIPNISLGTVYRNLNVLAEQGMIKRISIPQDVDHFDHRNDEHYHFYCTTCNHLIDLPVDRIDELIQRLEREENVEVNDYEVLLFGTCQSCRQSKRGRN